MTPPPPPTDGVDGSDEPDRPGDGDGVGTIVDVDVDEEMRESYLEYAYSVIYSRALPDARDGLKPVHRRILFQMSEMGLRPDRGHVKCARVVGDVMGKLHPHGDTAIYDALVRMAQPFSMRLPLVDGHGNFGSLDDGPAAYRYTECRLADAALLMTTSLDEDVVDMVPNYDDQAEEPAVLPAAYPNLLVNGATGIAVGMATNMAPHNLGEVVAAARHLLSHPEATLDELMRFVPGPDLPTGGAIVGLDGVREAYETGRGSFRTRANVEITQITARRKGIIVTELPYTIGPEKVIAKIKDLVLAKKLHGIADVKDLTDRAHGLRLVIEIKSGFNPDAVLAELYRQTPMEDSFGINAVCLVDGQPRTLGLGELLREFVGHRLEVVRRRSEYRRRKAAERAHIVEGMLLALANIDEVIAVIRTSDDTESARQRLMEIFELSQIQAGYILDMQLRRLVRLEVDKLLAELAELRATIAELTRVLESDAELRELVSDELLAVSAQFATPRRTLLLEGSGQRTRSTEPLEIPDTPCRVLLSATGRVARTADADPVEPTEGRSDHDLVVAAITSTTRSTVGLLTDAGRLVRLEVTELPGLPPTAGSPSLRGGAPVDDLVGLERGESVVGLCELDEAGPGVALATRSGVVKRVRPEYPANKDAFEMITLAGSDRVVGAVQLTSGSEDLVLVTSDAHLLRFAAEKVRPQGRAGGGVAGISLSEGAQVLHFAAVTPTETTVVATLAGDSGALTGHAATSAKVSALSEYPTKGRATGGVRAQRFLRGEDVLLAAWVGDAPAFASTPAGTPVVLSRQLARRDGSGEPLDAATTLLGGPLG